MKGIDSTGAPLVHVPGWMDGWMGGWMDGWMGGWMGGWMDGSKSRFKYCLQQSKIKEMYATSGPKPKPNIFLC
jgi:hypothetical protein